MGEGSSSSVGAGGGGGSNRFPISKVLTFFSREGFHDWQRLVSGAIEMREMSEIVETLFEMEGVSNVCIKIWLRSKCNFFSRMKKPSNFYPSPGDRCREGNSNV